MEKKTAAQKQQIQTKKRDIHHEQQTFNKLKTRLLTLTQEYPDTEELKQNIIVSLAILNK